MNPPGSDRDLGAGRGRQRGGRSDTVNGVRHRHAAQSTETSDGLWRVVCVGDVKVDRNPHRERRWGVGTTERCYKYERLLMGGQ